VVQIDTAEAHLPAYDITRPDRSAADYSDRLRSLVVAKIDDLLGPELATGVRHAVAIEEIDAWVLTIYETQAGRDTSMRLDPKDRLHFLLGDKTRKGKAPERMSREKKSRERKPHDDETHGKKKSEYALYDERSIAFCDGGKLDACAQ